MTVTTLRERAGETLLRAGTEVAFDQQALERSLATVPNRRMEFSIVPGR
jgi:hypothetical protein